MFGSNGPCSPMDYLPHYTSSILEPIYYPTAAPPDTGHHPGTMSFGGCDSEDSAPPTPDIISGLISLGGGPSPEEMSSGGSFGDMVSSPEDYHSTSSPTSSYSVDVSRVQATRSKLIKEGLKLTIQSRRMVNGLDNVRPEYRQPLQEELTKEDEERRRRRRERNKVAATKCRNKKKERTGKLAEESETLEVNNNALKTEIHSLEQEKNELINILQGHMPHCAMHQAPPLQHQHHCYQGHQVSSTNMAPSWNSVSG